MIHATDHRLGDLALSQIANHPFAAWDNILPRSTLTGDVVAADGARENAATWTTYDRWRPAGVGAKQITAHIAASEAPVTFLAVSAHNLSKIGASVQWAYNASVTGGTWLDLDAVEADDGVMAWRIMPTLARRWRLTVNVPTGKAASVGCIFIGSELIFPMPFYQGFSPRITPTNIELESNVSEGGNLMGSAVLRTGSSLSVSLNLLPEWFVRGDFGPFMDWFNRARGIIFAWRPMKYPQDVHYGWRQGAVIRPENSGPKDYMSAAMEMRVFDG